MWLGFPPLYVEGFNFCGPVGSVNSVFFEEEFFQFMALIFIDFKDFMLENM